ncbi:MAG TPA: hypothetical protein VGJ87_03225 [Roseiflexaceae bacterium]|jgi:hypothetical protein
MADDTTTAALSAKQYNAIAALMTQPSVRQACEFCNIPERTMYRWLKDKPFADEYRAARREAVSQAISQVQQYSSAMVRELCRLAFTARSEAIRLGAVSKGLDLAIKAAELDDLMARLEALESLYADKAIR